MVMKKSKRIRARDEGVDLYKSYALPEALNLIKERATAKFDETVEVVFSCAIDPQKGDQNIRGMVSLPQGTGKSIRVAVFAEGEQAREAQEAGAEVVGGSDLVEEVQKGNIDFDLCIATPAMMSQLSKLGKVLGPKGLMPNPKLGTVTLNVASAVLAAKRGQVSLRADKAGLIHAFIGKSSFSVEALEENFSALLTGLLNLKPSGIKGDLIKRAYVSSTMGFALPLEIASEARKSQ